MPRESVAGDEPAGFGTFPSEVRRLRDQLKANRVQNAAPETAGVCWFCVQAVLEAAGLEVAAVNGRHVKTRRAARPAWAIAGGCWSCAMPRPKRERRTP